MTDDRQPTEAELLAPWSVTRKLSDADEAIVQAAMTDRTFAHQMQLAEDERRGTVEVSERIAAPSRESLDKLMDMIDAEPKRGPSLMSRLSSAFQSFGLTGAPAGAVMAGLAAVVLIQGGMLSRESLGQPDAVSTAPVAEPATAPTEATRSVVINPAFLKVAFDDDASMGEITELLGLLGGTITNGPDAGLYRVRFDSKAVASAALVQLEERTDLVDSAYSEGE
jgi:hypothetical protein